MRGRESSVSVLIHRRDAKSFSQPESQFLRQRGRRTQPVTMPANLHIKDRLLRRAPSSAKACPGLKNRRRVCIRRWQRRDDSQTRLHPAASAEDPRCRGLPGRLQVPAAPRLPTQVPSQVPSVRGVALTET